LEDSKDILSLILSRVGNFWFTHPESVKKFSELKYWESLYLQSSEEKSIYVSNVLVEIFSQLDAFDSAQFSKVVVSQLSKQLSEDEQIILGESLWSLNNEELRTSLETDSTIIKLVGLKLLLERRLSLHSDTLSKLLNFASLVPVLNEFIVQDLVVFNDFSSFFKSIINIEGTLPVFKSLSQHEEALTELVEFALAKNDPIFIAYIASSLNESSIKDLEGSESLSSLLDQAKSKALELIQNEEFEDVSFNQLLNIFTFQHTSVSEDEKHRLIEYSLTKVSNKYTSEISNLVKAFGLYESSLIRTWINKSVLYLTKIYAEYTVFPASFLGFVESFKDLLLNIKISKFLNKLNINALLEVVFTKWIKDEKSLELASVIIVTGSKSIFEYKKLLQILINNEDISLLRSGPSKVKFYSALLISKLFDFDVSRNSNKAIQDKILSFYGGSTKPEDLVLFSVLEKLESKLNASWIDQVYNWEFFDLLNEGEEELIGEIKLIEKKKEGFLVTLNKKYIQNGLNNYIVVRHKLPILKSSDRENWAQLQNFYESVVIDSPENPSDTKYDPLFLSLMIINNDELIEITSDEDSPDLLVKSNMKKLIESELFSSIITNLASSDDSVQMVTKNILGSLLNSLKDEKTSPTFRDRHIFELFITKILFTFTQPDYTKEQFSPLIFIFITSLIPVLTNPGHILFEKAYRWILKSPSIRPNEIPLFQEITTISGSGEDSEVYYRELTWLLNNFVKGVQNKEDVQLLRNKNIFEWLLNLQNSPYVNTRIKYLIIELIYVLQNVEEGADILVARFGGLSSIEQRISAIIGDLQGKKGVDELQKEQELLNLRQVALKFGIIGQSKKRIVDWTNDDIGGFIKRVTKDSV
jgi:nucleolar pre-ribosomal-associated protein 1